ncbi:protein-L-isoaspartate O-methyltransferase family protein [Sphingomicrobium clamense]|uniref:Protein-L-isoaspartate O-methyltransferase n=1 Tax=Sphingomicrobium clamense TaxID=2851013 RepID=A0ABS6V7R5_9SPHN|nr:protein-L-isoaspartate O-methyltransferase [Sphingomicrobium sp. B8]MBW0145554.1 protein-L-isoaspartate O-methyltransferase [Sphingomicrobium sp. B8]
MIADSENLRRIMIDSQLRPQGVNDPAVLAAFAAVPREDYVPEERAGVAYRDRSVPLGEGRALIAPAALGMMLTEATLSPGDKALVVGPGSNYAAALLDEMGLETVALDDEAPIGPKPSKAAKGKLDKGHAKGGPYDLILIVGAVEELPAAYRKQLVDGGQLVTGIFDGGVTRLARGVKVDDRLALHPFADAQLPVLPQFAKVEAFAF